MDNGIANSRLSYTDGMRMILVMLVSLMFVACNNPEAENLKKENADLKTQLETVTKERDVLKVQLDGIKAVLENATVNPSTPTPDPNSTTTTPDSTTTTPATPDSSAGSGLSSSTSTPSNTPSSNGSSTPDSSSTTITPDSNSSGTDNKPTSAVETYAKDVLETAKKYNAETQQTPPTDCSNGYTAGTHAVPSSDAIESCRVDRLEKGFRVTLKDANGTIMTLPAP